MPQLRSWGLCSPHTRSSIPARRRPNTADIDAGLSDFRQGRFAEALQDWSKAAAAGDARGYLYIGVLYDTGLGVPQDYRQAMGLVS